MRDEADYNMHIETSHYLMNEDLETDFYEDPEPPKKTPIKKFTKKIKKQSSKIPLTDVSTETVRTLRSAVQRFSQHSTTNGKFKCPDLFCKERFRCKKFLNLHYKFCHFDISLKLRKSQRKLFKKI